jgi:hypothetical protein
VAGATLTRHFTEDLQDVSVDEIEIARGQLKNRKAPGEDGVTTELLKTVGKPVLREIQKLFNVVSGELRIREIGVWSSYSSKKEIKASLRIIDPSSC